MREADPSLLSQLVNKMKKVVLSHTRISKSQVHAIFNAMTEDNCVEELDIRGKDFSETDENILASCENELGHD